MKTRFVLCALLLLAGAARAQDPVRTELAAALEGRAAGLPPKAELREYAALLRAPDKPKAKARLDALDRSKLTPADLRSLSEAYVLLGYFDAGAASGQALQDRDPSGTQGLKLAARAKIEGKDFAGALALAQEALKINPNDTDAAALLYSAKGRGAPSASAPATVPPAPPSPAAQDVPSPRAPLIFTPRPKGGVPSSLIPLPEETANETEGVVSRGTKWVKLKIEEAAQSRVERLDRWIGLRPGEEATALKGARNGAAIGAGAGGLIIGGYGVAACGPIFATVVPYGACVAGVGAGGVIAGSMTVSYAGAAVSVGIHRARIFFKDKAGFDLDESPKAE